MNFFKTIQTQDGELVVQATTLRIRASALRELAALQARAADDPARQALLESLGDQDQAEGTAIRMHQVVRWGEQFPKGMTVEDLLDLPLLNLVGLLHAGAEVDAEANSFRGRPDALPSRDGGGGQPDRLERGRAD